MADTATLQILEIAKDISATNASTQTAIRKQETTLEVLGETMKSLVEGQKGNALEDEERRRKEAKAVSKRPLFINLDKTGIKAADIGIGFVGAIVGLVKGLSIEFGLMLKNASVVATKAIKGFYTFILGGKNGRILTFLRSLGNAFTTAFKFPNLVKAMNLQGITRPIAALGGFVGRITQFFQNIGKQIQGVLKSLRDSSKLQSFFQAMRNFGLIIIKPFTDAQKTITATIKGLQGGGKALKMFAKVGDFVKKAFPLFRQFGAMFTIIGRVIFIPLNAIIGLFAGISGMFKGIEEQTEKSRGIGFQILGGLTGAIEGIINTLVMMPLDFLKSAVAWILNLIGLDFIADILSSFSFQDLFSGLVDMFMGLFDGFEDGFMSGVTGMFTGLLKIMGRIIKFPLALAAGAGAALGGLFFGDPIGAFKSTFNKVLTAGEGIGGELTSKIGDAMTTTPAGKDRRLERSTKESEIPLNEQISDFNQESKQFIVNNVTDASRQDNRRGGGSSTFYNTKDETTGNPNSELIGVA